MINDIFRYIYKLLNVYKQDKYGSEKNRDKKEKPYQKFACYSEFRLHESGFHMKG